MDIINLIIDLKYKCFQSEQKIMAKLKLDLSEYQAINKIEDNHNITCNEIAKLINLSVSRSSRVIDKMVKKNILRRVTDKEDKRSKLISLTKTGIRIKHEINEQKKICEEKITGAFNKNELSVIESNIKKLIKAL